jgi:hypothetical protein
MKTGDLKGNIEITWQHCLGSNLWARFIFHIIQEQNRTTDETESIHFLT